MKAAFVYVPSDFISDFFGFAMVFINWRSTGNFF